MNIPLLAWGKDMEVTDHFPLEWFLDRDFPLDGNLLQFVRSSHFFLKFLLQALTRYTPVPEIIDDDLRIVPRGVQPKGTNLEFFQDNRKATRMICIWVGADNMVYEVSLIVLVDVIYELLP